MYNSIRYIVHVYCTCYCGLLLWWTSNDGREGGWTSTIPMRVSERDCSNLKLGNDQLVMSLSSNTQNMSVLKRRPTFCFLILDGQKYSRENAFLRFPQSEIKWKALPHQLKEEFIHLNGLRYIKKWVLFVCPYPWKSKKTFESNLFFEKLFLCD